MTFGQLQEYILSTVGATDRKEVARMANYIINEINAKIGGYLETETVVTFEDEVASQSLTFANDNPDTITGTGFNSTEIDDGMYVHAPSAETNTGTYLTAAHSNTIISLDADEDLSAETVTSTLELYTVTSNYTWDAGNLLLTVPDYVGQIKHIFENDEDIEHYNHAWVYDSGNSSENIMTALTRSQIKFPDSILAENNSLKIRYWYHIPHISDQSNSADISVPRQWEHMLISGVQQMFYIQPKYFNEANFQFWNTKYLSSIEDVKQNMAERMPPVNQKTKWKY